MPAEYGVEYDGFSWCDLFTILTFIVFFFCLCKNKLSEVMIYIMIVKAVTQRAFV